MRSKRFYIDRQNRLRLPVLTFGLILLAGIIGPASGQVQASAVTVVQADAAYRAAIDNARSGRLDPAMASLRALVERFPDRQDMLCDYAVVLGWAAEHDAALALLDRIERTRAPAYVLEGLANSARRLARHELAQALYRESMARWPKRPEAQIGLLRSLIDGHQFAAAALLLATLRAGDAQRIDLLGVATELANAQHDDFAALAAEQAILAQQPDNRAALHDKILTLARLGTPQLAIEIADRHPGVLSDAERDSVAADRTAHQIRWGAIAADSGRGTARFATLDLALADSEAAAALALDPQAPLGRVERQRALDRISALRERYRMRDAVALYEAMAARPEPLPAYARSAAASAYLYLERPEMARDLYRQTLLGNPDDLESRIGLFYALAENEEHDAALAVIEQVGDRTPLWIDAWSPQTVRENPAYLRALSARAMAPLLANRPGEAEQRLHQLVDSAPFNSDTRTDYASSMRARGWPRRAEQELRWLLAVDPEHSGALGERTGALLEMNDFANARAALATAQAVSAEDGRVVRAARQWQVHDLRELIVDGNFGRSGGGPTGNRDYSLDTHLFSAPLAENYRAYVHTYTAQARFDAGNGQRKRVGAGVEYRSPLITATGELAHEGGQEKTAASATLAFTPDDFWTLRGEYEQSANQTPLQASLAGIDARRLASEAIWRANESRAAAVSYDNMAFDDGNRRDIVQARWTERVVAGPVYKMELTGAVYASRNSRGSLADSAYFNPSSDFSPTLEVANEWLQWRRYTRAFRHRLVLAAGSYRQQGFAAGAVYDLRYEHEWEADDRITLRYGIGRNLHPYDGVVSARNYGYFYLNGKF
jgi:biofilm PGA synthesis protein PgaA